MDHIINHIDLLGALATAPEFSHENHGRRFYSFFLEVERLSGTVDRLRVLCPEQLLEETELGSGEAVGISGQVRSFNLRTDTGRRLVISVFAEQLALTDGAPENRVQLEGTLCKPPVYRRTPLGREICDVMLAVNRPYHRADYLPCIFWGKTAQAMADLPVGTAVALEGRLQSRSYVKQLPEGAQTRTAYEISVISSQVLPAPSF